MTKRAARAHLAAALLGTTQAPARTPPSPLFASLVACDGFVRARVEWLDRSAAWPAMGVGWLAELFGWCAQSFGWRAEL